MYYQFFLTVLSALIILSAPLSRAFDGVGTFQKINGVADNSNSEKFIGKNLNPCEDVIRVLENSDWFDGRSGESGHAQIVVYKIDVDSMSGREIRYFLNAFDPSQVVNHSFAGDKKKITLSISDSAVESMYYESYSYGFLTSKEQWRHTFKFDNTTGVLTHITSFWNGVFSRDNMSRTCVYKKLTN